MPKVLCKLPNTSTKINGFNFVKHRDGMISEELDAKVAEELATIPGYEIHDPSGVDPAAQAILEAARKQREAEELKQQGRQQPPAPPAPPAAPPAPPVATGKPAETPPAPPPAPPAPKADHSTSSSTPPAGTPPADTSEPQF